MSRWCASAQRPGQNRAPRLASASRWPLRRQPAISSLSSQGGSLGAARQSRSTSVEAPEPAPRCIRSSTAPLGGRRDTQRSACDAPRKAASWYAADTYGNIRLASPEGSVHAENHGKCYQSSYALPVGTPMTGHGYQNRLRLRRSRIGAGGWFWVIPDFPGP